MKSKNLSSKKNEVNRWLIPGVIIALLLSISIQSCQKEESLPIVNSDDETFQKVQLKSTTISLDDIDALILMIQNYVLTGEPGEGIVNSFIMKLQNVKMTLEKGNEKAAINQLQALINQLEELIAEGTIDVSIGEKLIVETMKIKGEWTCGQPFVDPRDNNVYQTVKIGNVCWMAENLKATKLNDGTEMDYLEPNSGTGVYAWYDEDYEKYGSVYGALYDETALKSGKLCPIGWHVSTDDDWKQLEIQIGMNPDVADLSDWRGEVGNLLKATDGWSNDGNGTDIYGFNALPGGSAYLRRFFGEGERGVWWSPSEESYSMIRELSSESAGINRQLTKKGLSSSVRCVKD